jgi:hypothetical protein
MVKEVTNNANKSGVSDSAAAASARKGWAESTTAATPYTGSPGGVKIGTVTSNNGSNLVVGIYAEAVAGGVKFWVQVESGTGDLRGFFLDVGSPGGPITRAGSGDNNMNGTGYTFDYGVEIGSSGSSKDYSTKAAFTLYDLNGTSLASLIDGAVFGIRATSVGSNNTSVKLVGTASVPEVTVSITANGDVLENAPAAFTLHLDMAVGADMLVTLSNGATVIIPAGATSVAYVNGTQGDDVYIDPSSVSVSITSAVPQSPILTGVMVDDDAAVVNVTDTIDPVIVRLSATPSTSEDGGSIVYSVQLEKTSDGSSVTTANAITVTLTGGQVIVIPAGASSASSDPVPVNRDDVWLEVDAITNRIASATEANAGTTGAFESLTFDDSLVSTQILDDTDPVTVGIYNNDGEREPGDPAYFIIRIDQALDSDLIVSLSNGATVTVLAGSTEQPYTYEDPPLGDTTVSIESAVVTGKTFESLIVSPDSALVTDPPPDDEHFPTLDKNISHITIYFSAAAGSGLESSDRQGGSSSSGQNGADGLYTVKIDWLENDLKTPDLDSAWSDIYARLLQLNPALTGKEVLGVAIKAGNSESFYALDGDPDVDPIPQRYVDGQPVNTLVVNSGVDTVYTSDSDDDGRNDFFEPAGMSASSGGAHSHVPLLF